MYRFLLLLLPLLMLACQPRKDGAFVISGQIKGAPKGKILLQQLPYNGNAPVVVDSGTLKENGTFTLRSAATGEGMYRIFVDQGPELYFINDNNRIKVRMDAAHARNPEFEDSEASEQLYHFLNAFFSRDSSIRMFYQDAEQRYRQSGNSDSVLRGIEQQSLQKVQQMKDFIKKTARETESPALAHFAISRGFQYMGAEEGKALVNETFKKHKDHPGLKALKGQIDAATVQQVPQEKPPYELINQQAPDLTMNDVNGKPVSVSQFRGKYVLIDFWASWCAPCRRENPNVVAAYNKYKDRNFTVLGVSLDADKEDWVKAIKDDNLTWPHMSDLKQWESSAVPIFKFGAIPFNVLLDPSGKIIASDLRGAELDRSLGEILK